MSEARFRHVGVVEGFYGRVWEEVERFAFIEALLPFGIDTYLYAPKHEPALAARVMELPTPAESARLAALAAHCAARGVAPWAGLHLEPRVRLADGAHLTALARKCEALAGLGWTGFVIQYDDVAAPAEGDSLAALHGAAVTAIREEAGALGVEARWGVVPALYTLDPILQREYGPFEPDYLARLDAALPPDVAWFCTGPKVCSPSLTRGDVAAWRSGSHREVMLWDNYPVNDAAMVHHLHLAPLTGRAPDLSRDVAGYLFNPMVQPALGAVGGATCAAYGHDPSGYRPEAAWEQALGALLPEPARRPMRELEALTRRSCLEAYPPDGSLGADGALAGRLVRAWNEGAGGGPKLGEAASDLSRIVADLRRHLPRAMAEEAAPWLDRLERAAAVMAAPPGSPARASAASAFRSGEAFVLGPWFAP